MSYDQQLADALREIERLKAEQLTPEEARLIDVPHIGMCGYDEWDHAECHCKSAVQTARAKLRRLSHSDTGDTNG